LIEYQMIAVDNYFESFVVFVFIT